MLFTPAENDSQQAIAKLMPNISGHASARRAYSQVSQTGLHSRNYTLMPSELLCRWMADRENRSILLTSNIVKAHILPDVQKSDPPRVV